AEAAAIARDAAISADEKVARAAQLDWEMLHRMFLGKFPDFGEPVDAADGGMLGPLFADGAAPRQPAALESAGAAAEPMSRRQKGRGGARRWARARRNNLWRPRRSGSQSWMNGWRANPRRFASSRNSSATTPNWSRSIVPT